jgi:hypothetical protein
MTATEGLAQVNTLATHTALTAWNFGSDFLVVIVLTFLFVLFARGIGRGPFVALILSFYCAYALYDAFPYMSYLSTALILTALLTHIGLYFTLCILFYIVLRRVVVSDFLYIGIPGLILLSFFSAGFLLALGYHVFSFARWSEMDQFSTRNTPPFCADCASQLPPLTSCAAIAAALGIPFRMRGLISRSKD